MKLFKSNGFRMAAVIIGAVGALMVTIALLETLIFDMDFGTGMKWSVIVMVGLMLL